MAIVETHDLTKEFDSRKAVNQLNLTIEEGELFGLLGPNGAGKTTLVHLLSTILHPTRGTAVVGGHDVKGEPREVREVIGVVPQEGSVYEGLTAMENLRYFGKLHDMEGAELEKRAEELLKLTQLKDRANDYVKTFSSGMKHRLSLAVGLVHRPSLLFLDEPTTGLDPTARLAVWEFIKSLQEEGVTTLLTTHYMEEADYLCDRVAIMNDGKIIELDTPAALKRSIGELEVIEIKAAAVPDEFTSKAGELRKVKEATRTPEGLRLLTPNADMVLSKVVELASKTELRMESLKISQPTLEDVFIKLTGRTLRD